MKVKRLPVDTGNTGWNSILPDRDQPKMLQGDINADYLVIGGGFAGLSAARRLAQLQPDAGIVLLDATRIGEGPAGRNSGFMIDLPHDLSSTNYATSHENDLKQIRLNRQAIAFAADVASEYGFPDEAFDHRGKVNGAAGEKATQHNFDYAKHLDELGESYQLRDAAAMEQLTGSDFYQSGIYTPGTALLQPALYVRELAKALAKTVSIYENSPVVSLAFENGKWKAVSPCGGVSAKKVILATNGHIESFGFFERQVFHVILYGSMTRELNDEENASTGDKRWGITPSDPSATTMRKISGIGGTRIITRNQMSYAPAMQISQSRLTKVGEQHKNAFSRRYPELENVEQEFCWSGRLCLSLNSAPAFGEVSGGLYSACCQNGLGTTKGTLAGIAAAEMAAEGVTDLAQALIDEGKPKKLPPWPLDTIGATSFMRWGEFKAKEEL